MILKIKSINDFFLDILYKNPDIDNGLYCKPLKNDQVIGNAVNKLALGSVFTHVTNSEETLDTRL
jgi:hypothetical protein